MADISQLHSGDELFGGYRRYAIEKYRPLLLLFNLIFENKLFNNAVDFLPNYRKIKKLISAMPIRDDVLRYTRWLNFFSPEMQQSLFGKGFLSGKEDSL